ncbi:hypothetical protein DL766_009477 [Monosporascus sp. MC13-8B]|uniref:DUF7730 domain-containing protein n=1 Tax=Monosporascus cannonballus TaxID=155416 RepID=A0ABY0GX33_9PEZI|nr:hypothetical protein DL762_008363 [Monosporascus cannonballus]RYO99172.1 hypothetical protein DL763_001662 [Monosporascus cannonballus]RYP15178.1 hypothetical protein DL766_009477 [Monosporascus sp. MC13-8B]
MGGENPGEKPEADAQRQSLFFQLPSEIRLQILALLVYEGAASQHIVHFEGERGFMRLPCRPAPDADVKFRNALEWFSLNNSPWRGGHLRCCRALSGRRGQRRNTGDRLSSPLPLLLACRRLHEETADVLYASLSFVGLKPLRRFLRQTRAEHLERVRTVNMQWEGVVRSLPTFNLDFEDWAPTCERLAKLSGLRMLRVKIFVCSRTNGRLAELFLRPLQAVKVAEVVSEVVRNCWDYHPNSQKKTVTSIVLGDYEVPIRVCNVSLQDRWPGDHVLEQTPSAA